MQGSTCLYKYPISLSISVRWPACLELHAICSSRLDRVGRDHVFIDMLYRSVCISWALALIHADSWGQPLNKRQLSDRSHRRPAGSRLRLAQEYIAMETSIRDKGNVFHRLGVRKD